VGKIPSQVKPLLLYAKFASTVTPGGPLPGINDCSVMFPQTVDTGAGYSCKTNRICLAGKKYKTGLWFKYMKFYFFPRPAASCGTHFKPIPEHCDSIEEKNNCYLKRLQLVVREGGLIFPGRYFLHNLFLWATILPVRLCVVVCS
jgi:hypothetical protein